MIEHGQAAADNEVTQQPGQQLEFARKIALRRLDAKAQSRAELAEYLAKKEVPTEIATKLLDRFEEVGLLNDLAYAQAWVESRRRTRNLSAAALKRELRGKGLADEIIEEATGEISVEDDRAAALRLARQKARSMRNLDAQVAFRRLAGQLARRGHSPGITIEVVKQALQEVAEQSPDD